MTERVIIVLSAPHQHVDEILQAIHEAGGGRMGEYSHSAYLIQGEGRFKASESAHPGIGEPGRLNKVGEVRIETFCDRADAKRVLSAIRAVHPYEEPIIYLIPMLDEHNL
jgi:hypothetical protein